MRRLILILLILNLLVMIQAYGQEPNAVALGPVLQDTRVKAIARPVYDRLRALGAKNLFPFEKIYLVVTDRFSVIPSGKIIGMCMPEHNGRRAIVILRDVLEHGSLALQEQLLLHELGHCALNLDHYKYIKVGTKNVPGTVMEEFVIDDRYFEKYKDYYYKELFQ